MDPKRYIWLLKRWFWLIVLAACLGGAIGYLISSRRPPVYEARTTIAIGRFMEVRNPDASDIRIGIDLTQNYAQLVTTYDLLQEVIDELSLPMSAEQLRGHVKTQIISGTSLLVISVTYTDAVAAADMANTLARQLILKSPTNPTPDESEQLALAREEITELRALLRDLRQRLERLDAELLNTRDQVQIGDLTAQRNVLVTQINDASNTLVDFSTNLGMLQQNRNRLDVVETARVPTQPQGPGALSTGLLSAIMGMLLAVIAMLVVDYLDDTLRTPGEVKSLTGLPLLGTVARFGGRKDKYPERLITLSKPFSAASESYRAIQTKLLSLPTKDTPQVFLITSPGENEGKSVFATNLAISFASVGLHTLLIDADLRSPSIHEMFGLENEKGLTQIMLSGMIRGKMSSSGSGNGNGTARKAKLDAVAEMAQVMTSTVVGVLNGQSDIADDVRARVEAAIEKTGYREAVAASTDDYEEDPTVPIRRERFMHNTSVPDLSVITSGLRPTDPARVLGTFLLHNSLHKLWKSANFDVVVIDTPPCLAVGDAMLIAGRLNAGVLLLAESGRTQRDALVRARDQFTDIGCKVIGMVLNKMGKNGTYGDK